VTTTQFLERLGGQICNSRAAGVAGCEVLSLGVGCDTQSRFGDCPGTGRRHSASTRYYRSRHRGVTVEMREKRCRSLGKVARVAVLLLCGSCFPHLAHAQTICGTANENSVLTLTCALGAVMSSISFAVSVTVSQCAPSVGSHRSVSGRGRLCGSLPRRLPQLRLL
jgi:hypothetical protein